MAVFVGDGKETTAVRAALKINWALKNIVVSERNAFYKNSGAITLNHVVGVDTSELFVARTGVRGSNDLVWVGRVAHMLQSYLRSRTTTPPTSRMMSGWQWIQR